MSENDSQLKRIFDCASRGSPQDLRALPNLMIRLPTKTHQKAGRGWRTAGELAHLCWQTLQQSHWQQWQAEWDEMKTKISLPEEHASHIRRFIQRKIDQESLHWRGPFQPSTKALPKSAAKIRPIDPVKGHANAIRNLTTTQKWTVWIDETGSSFEPDESGDNQLPGKIVALVVPDYCPLAALTNFHGADATTERVVEVLDRLLDGPVGVLGFEVESDPVLGEGASWLASVWQLMRWLMRLLPLTDGQEGQVEFLIEQRGVFDTGESLLALTELLHSDLCQLAPQRFGQVRLVARLVDKQHPQIGWVDALAYVWGSPKLAMQSALSNTGLSGQCLFRGGESLERCYQALDGKPLSAEDWLQLWELMLHQPGISLLNHKLERLGQSLRQEPQRWLLYLAAIDDGIRRKQWSLPLLQQALAQLQECYPKTPIPPRQELLFLSCSLVIANHSGQVNRRLWQQLNQLSRSLMDECAPEVCEVSLRLAVTATNALAFNEARKLIEPWLAPEQLPVCGLRNWAKAQSLNGQLAAFQNKRAKPWFEAALAAFARLSDADEAQREIEQTQIYRLIYDCDHAEPWQLRQQLAEFLGNPESAVVALAASGHAQRYRQHLLLRCFIHHPQQFADWIAVYLQQQSAWRHEKGHPWPLINAWRGWLLAEAGQTEAAAELWQRALAQCQQPDSDTLHWMGAVLQAVAVQLAILGVEPVSPEQQAELQQRLKKAQHGALVRLCRPGASRQELLKLLRAALPFNFH